MSGGALAAAGAGGAPPLLAFGQFTPGYLRNDEGQARSIFVLAKILPPEASDLAADGGRAIMTPTFSPEG